MTAGRHKSCGTYRTMGFPGRSYRKESSSRKGDRILDYCFPYTCQRNSGCGHPVVLDHFGHDHHNKGPGRDRNHCPSRHSCRSHHNRCNRSCSRSECSSFPCCSCHYCTSRHCRDHTYRSTVDRIQSGSIAMDMVVAHSTFRHTDLTLYSWPAEFRRPTSSDRGPTCEPLRLQPESPRPSASCTAGLCS